uniref:Transmembrane protein n=1 Tax=Ditylenchus dipsaci TaxID=166011 RepID=A0A915DPU4_9BILA
MRRPSSLSHLSTFVRSRLSSNSTDKSGSGTPLPDQQHAHQQQQPATYQHDNEDEKAQEVLQDRSKAQEQSSNNSPRNSFVEEVAPPLDADNNSVKDQVLENASEENDADKSKQSEQVLVSQPPKEINYDEKPMAGNLSRAESRNQFPVHSTEQKLQENHKRSLCAQSSQDLATTSQNHQLQYYLAVNSAIFVQNCFHNFSLIIQGFLSGLAVGHAFFAFVFADPDVLIRGYQWMAVPAQSLFYFCYAISALDALDRFEMHKSFRIAFFNFVTLQKGALVVIIWLAGCACSILMTQTDEHLATWDLDILSNMSAKDSSWNNAQASDMLIQWRWLSCARAVLALLGWLFLALQPSANYSRDHLANFIPNFSQRLPESTTEKAFQASTNEGTKI